MNSVAASASWAIEADDERIGVVDPRGDAKVISFARLSRVVIETTDNGPFGDDVWWLLLGPDQKVAVRFPQSAEGEQAAVEQLLKLPGFDFDAMISAMGSSDQGFFPVWRKRT